MKFGDSFFGWIKKKYDRFIRVGRSVQVVIIAVWVYVDWARFNFIFFLCNLMVSFEDDVQDPTTP